MVTDTSVQPFVSVNTAVNEGYTGELFVLDTVANTSVNANTCDICATPVGYFALGLAGNAVSDSGTTQLYVKNVANQAGLLLSTDSVLKQEYANAQLGNVTTTAACTVVTGVGTTFTASLTVGTHVKFPSTGEDVVVEAVTNNTSFISYTPITTAVTDLSLIHI